MKLEEEKQNMPDDQHYAPSVRMCDVERPVTGSCGFHVTRSKWDPYPWVSGVDVGSPAEAAGLVAGDCVLEVNGEDVLGQRIGEVASRVRARDDRVSLLLWNAGSDPQCNPESLCCGPMPSNLQRLSACMNSILMSLECPVCLDTIPPPAHQCGNGHLICVKCRVKTEKCPVCRVRFCRARSLLADQVFNSMTDAFELKEEAEEVRPKKLRERLFGSKSAKSPKNPELKVNLVPPPSPASKFLTRIMGKASSVDNIASSNQPVQMPLSAMPRHLEAEFSSNLKAKSLSTSEIFHPGLSRSPSFISSSQPGLLDVPLNPHRRPASYHGSCESLEGRLESDFPDDGSLYYCPCEESCAERARAFSLMQHIQDCHQGPLVHYFKPRIIISFPQTFGDGALVAITSYRSTFFLKVLEQDSGEVFVWLWLFGSQKAAESYHLILKVKEAEFRSPAVSLAAASWGEVIETQTGIVTLSPDTLGTLAGIRMEVEIKDAPIEDQHQHF